MCDLKTVFSGSRRSVGRMCVCVCVCVCVWADRAR